MNFQESLDYLYGLQLFGIKLGLENMWALKNRLPELQKPLSSVHVAGTNGKGSVSVMLAEILRQAGLKVGLYTSPHLQCFSERIRINGTPVSREEIVQLADDIRKVSEGLSVTFFEATTAMALLAFARHQVDVSVVETGLGGRLDATNIIEPQLSVITPVSFDHSEHLGESLAEIAAEKAGIIKANTPVVVGKQLPESAEVFRRTVASCNANILAAEQDYFWCGHQGDFYVDVDGTRVDKLSCNLEGTHQIDNFAQAVAAAIQMRSLGFHITDENIRVAGKSVVWPGRLEWWGKGKKLLADVAHNIAGIECLVKYLQEKQIDQVHMVVGLSGERHPENVFKPLVKFVASVYAVPVSYNQVVTPEELCRWAESNGVTAMSFPSAAEGLSAALLKASPAAPVLVCGSLYLVAELREENFNGGTAPKRCGA